MTTRLKAASAPSAEKRSVTGVTAVPGNMMKYRASIFLILMLAVAPLSAYAEQTADPAAQEELARFTKELQVNPRYGRAYFNRGIAYLKLGNLDAGIADFTKAIELNPFDPEAYLYRGIAFGQKNNVDQVISDLTKAIEFKTQDSNLARYNRGLAYLRKENWDRAVSDFTYAVEADSGDFEAYYHRGLAYKNLNDFDQALSDFTRTMAINPRYADAYSSRAAIYFSKGDMDRALLDCDKAITESPDAAPDLDMLYYNRAITHYALDHFPQALRDYRAAIAITPKNRSLALAEFTKRFQTKKPGDAKDAHADIIKILQP